MSNSEDKLIRLVPMHQIAAWRLNHLSCTASVSVLRPPRREVLCAPSHAETLWSPPPRVCVCVPSNTCISANIGTLSRKLEFVLTIGADLYCLTEVRTPASGIKSMPRAAWNLGSDLSGGCPPEAPNLHSTAFCGGIAVFVVCPGVVRAIFSLSVQKWVLEGEFLTVAFAWPGRIQICSVTMCGFLKAHRLAGMNEKMISAALSWPSSLTASAFLTGDDTTLSSASLALVEPMECVR